MSETDRKDLVSKCVAIQYGVFMAGIVLLVVVTFNWYQDYSNQCLAKCKVQHQSCKVECIPPSKFTASRPMPVPPVMATRVAGTKLHEKQLEGFLNYAPDHNVDDFETQYVPEDEDPTVQPYDPARESLEQSVFDSHSEFVEDSYTSTQGPNSSNVERDDTNEVVKRWGLRRVDYTGVVPGDDARTVPSEYPSQVAQETDNYTI